MSALVPAQQTARVIAIVNQKGGVGKSTTAVNLGASLALLGRRVLVVDIDPQGNTTTGVGVDKRTVERDVYAVLLQNAPVADVTRPTEVENLWIVPSTLNLAGAEVELVSTLQREGLLKRALANVVGGYDEILIDCPPSLGLLTINALTAANEVIIPVQAEYYALEGLSQLIAIVRRIKEGLNPDLTIRGVLITMFDGRTKLATEVLEEVHRYFPDRVFRNADPAQHSAFRSALVRQAGDSVRREEPRSAGVSLAGARARVVTVKRGLGRGLGALLGDRETSDLTAPPRRDLQHVALVKIRPNPLQPRTTFEPRALDELRASIAAFGVLVPIIVRERGDGYELIAGERRVRAAQAAGLDTVPAIVRPADDRESLEVAIIENLQRENLDPLEEAMGFQHLMEAHAFTQEQVAERVGKSRPAVANALRLLSLPDAIKQYVRDGRLTAGHARAILALPVERRDAAARRAVAEGLSVRAVERFAQDAPPRRRAAPPARTSADADAFVERLRYKYATNVRHVPAERGGTIELRYADDGDLMRIVDLLLGEAD